MGGVVRLLDSLGHHPGVGDLVSVGARPRPDRGEFLPAAAAARSRTARPGGRGPGAGLHGPQLLLRPLQLSLDPGDLLLRFALRGLGVTALGQLGQIGGDAVGPVADLGGRVGGGPVEDFLYGVGDGRLGDEDGERGDGNVDGRGGGGGCHGFVSGFRDEGEQGGDRVGVVGQPEDVQEQAEVVLVVGPARGDPGCGGELLLRGGVKVEGLGFEGFGPVGEHQAALPVRARSSTRRLAAAC